MRRTSEKGQQRGRVMKRWRDTVSFGGRPGGDSHVIGYKLSKHFTARKVRRRGVPAFICCMLYR